MFLRNSRYRNAPPFAGVSNDAQQSASPGSAGNAQPAAGVVFRGVRARSLGPASPVLEHTLQAGDRLDALARHYYGDDRLWWRIVDANPEIVFGPDLLADDRLGDVILIPAGQEAPR